MANHNVMSRFPAPLCNIASLEEIDVSHNRISEVSAEIRNLSSLTILDLSNNQFEEFPYTVSGNL